MRKQQRFFNDWKFERQGANAESHGLHQHAADLILDEGWIHGLAGVDRSIYMLDDDHSRFAVHFNLSNGGGPGGRMRAQRITAAGDHFRGDWMSI